MLLVEIDEIDEFEVDEFEVDDDEVEVEIDE